MYQSYKHKNKKTYKRSNFRINAAALVAFLFASLIVSKFFKLQIIDYDFYNALATDQHQVLKKLFPKRGEIFINDNSSQDKANDNDIYSGLYPIAINKKYNFVYAEPDKIEDVDKTVQVLLELLKAEDEPPDEADEELEENESVEEEKIAEENEAVVAEEQKYNDLMDRLSQKDDPYEPLKHKVDDSLARKIKSLDLKGIKFAEEYFRHYPDENFGGHLIGFIGHTDNDDKKGQYGIEGYFNDLLSGKPGFIKTEKDVGGKTIKIWEESFSECEDGSDIVLTIDYNIQHAACKHLKSGVEEFEADGGTVIIMEPFTGALLGMCNVPDFNPLKYNEVPDIQVFNNPAIFNQYEPGSIFKSITAAIALDLNKIKPDTIYEDKGEIKIGSHTIKNSDLKAHGRQTMTQVLEESLNTGAIYMARQAGKDNFKAYLENFGFGGITGIELDTEVKGNISSLAKKGEIYTATASFGQGITVTPLQMAASYAALANGGKLPKPHIVDRIIKNKTEVTKIQPKIVRQVISERASALVSAMLVSVIESGHAKHAAVKGYYVAGKTGTAQVAESGAYGDRTIHSFVGFAPIENPKFVMIVKLDNPKTVRFSASSAAPIFGRLAEFLLNYYSVPPAR